MIHVHPASASASKKLQATNRTHEAMAYSSPTGKVKRVECHTDDQISAASSYQFSTYTDDYNMKICKNAIKLLRRDLSCTSGRIEASFTSVQHDEASNSQKRYIQFLDCLPSLQIVFHTSNGRLELPSLLSGRHLIQVLKRSWPRASLLAFAFLTPLLAGPGGEADSTLKCKTLRPISRATEYQLNFYRRGTKTNLDANSRLCPSHIKRRAGLS